jgi:predicted nucleic acid-binding protein
MALVTFDTSVIIAYQVQTVPQQYLWSAVVLAELTASAADDSIRKAHEATRRAYEQQGKLIVPTAEDWLLASRILFWLTQSRKKRAGGKAPPLKPSASQRMMMDALIAVSARRVGATVVTDDYDDFKAIQYYCQVRLRRGSDYFGRGGSKP